MENQQKTIQDQLEILEKFTDEAKNVKTGAAFYYLVWGIVLTSYCLINYAGMALEKDGVWMIQYSWIVFPIGGILSGIRSKKDEITETAVTFKERVYKMVWLGTAFAFVILMTAAAAAMQVKGIIPMSLLLMGLSSFSIGGIIRNYSLLIGGIICMLLTIWAFFVGLQDQLLIASLGMFAGILAPGLFMKFNLTKHV